MSNRFYNLPEEIQNYIYGIRLYNILSNKFSIRIAQKLVMVKVITELYQEWYDGANTPGHISDENYVIYDPFYIRIAYIADKCSRVFYANEYTNWWVIHLIRPLERGIIMYDCCGSGAPSYDKTKIACEKLIKKLKCNRINYHLIYNRYGL